jgi:renalase
VRVVVVGAGLSGLVAARRLADEHEVIVLDKGRSVGGRLATRRVGEAVLDHGAQFFTVRGNDFRSQVDDWLDRGLAHVWCHGFATGGDGYPRYVGSAGMNSLAKDLATGLDCRTNQLVFTLRRQEEGWDVVIDDGSVVAADAVVLTAPVAQSWALLAQSDLDVPDGLFRQRVPPHDRTAHRARPTERGAGARWCTARPGRRRGTVRVRRRQPGEGREPDPGGDVPRHTTVEPRALGRRDDSLRRELLERAAPYLGAAEVVEAQVKKWRFAGPVEPWPDPCWVDDEYRVVLAGDLFAGPKLEGAFDSGVAAAAAVASFA